MRDAYIYIHGQIMKRLASGATIVTHGRRVNDLHCCECNCIVGFRSTGEPVEDDGELGEYLERVEFVRQVLSDGVEQLYCMRCCDGLLRRTAATASSNS